MFQAVLTVESDDETASTHCDPAPLPYPAQVDETEDDEKREYYTDVIDGVRTLRSSVVVPPDGPPASLDIAPETTAETPMSNVSTPFTPIPVGARECKDNRNGNKHKL